MPVIARDDADSQEWHALDAEAVIARLESGRRYGLAQDEVQRRLARFGPNKLPPRRQRPWWMRILLQFHNVLIYVMLTAAFITASLGHLIDTGVLLAAVLVNAAIGYIQEGKAEQALDAIRNMLSPHSIVIRNGETMTVPAEQLVPGDIVLLASRDKVPAD
ncbi:MAG: cation-transporting P-type ATPase, partial [Burkholderiaceae bacterium]